MDVNSFMNTKQVSGTKSKDFDEIVDLKKAYDFAREHPLTEQHLLEAHRILSRLILSPGNQGIYRQDKVAVFSSRGLQYMAVEYEHVPTEMEALFGAIDAVIAEKPDTQHALYYSSLAHLNFAHIHPFMDGNGRIARLLEKWFLATLIGDHAWQIESEKYYKEHQREYYRTIALGVNYYELEYNQCVPFLLQLQHAILASTVDKNRL